MHAPTEKNTISRRSDKSSWTSVWLAMVCALLLVSPGQAAPSLSQARQTASYETVFYWLQNAETESASRAQVLQTLCRSAGLNRVQTANVLNSYQQWTREHSTSQLSASAATLPASTCRSFAPIVLRDTRPFDAKMSRHTGRAAHSLAVCYLE